MMPLHKDATPGEKLRYYRIMNGISQEQLGEAVGRTMWGIVNYEKEFNNLHYSEAVKFAEILGIDPEELLDEYTHFCKPGFGKAMATIRHKYLMSQKEFAKLIGAGRDDVAVWEVEWGDWHPNRDVYTRLKKLAEDIDIDLQHLAEHPEEYPDEYQIFIEKDCAKKIKYIRSRYHCFQFEFADMIGGIGRSAVGFWENGSTVPQRQSYDSIKNLAEAKGIDIDILNRDPDYYRNDYFHFIDRDYGKKIFYLRLLYDMTQEEFGKMIGCSGNTMSEWEAENVIPGREYFEQLKSMAEDKGINLSEWNEDPTLYRDAYTEFKKLQTWKKIKELRSAYGLSQTEFAKLIGISKTSYNVWESENRHRYPSRPFF